MSTDDPDTYEPTMEELLTLNAALRLRLDLVVSALGSAAYVLNEAAADVDDEEFRERMNATVKVAHGALAIARGTSTEIPPKLAAELSLQRRAHAQRLLEETRG